MTLTLDDLLPDVTARSPQAIRYYHVGFDPDGAIVKLCDAIEDKEHGLGLIWIGADIDGLLAELDQYPRAWVIAQDRDTIKKYLKEKLDYKKEKNE
jgi:hypothetical protein